MAWTYSGNPAASPLDEVRFLIGDTNPAQPQLQDAEITYNISLTYGSSPPSGGNFLPAAHCADVLAARAARTADKSVGDLRISFSQVVKQFQDLARALRRRATLAEVPVYAGGQSLADKLASYTDADMPQAAVKIDGMNYASGVNDQGDGTDGSIDGDGD